jgi:hypothetical protein
MTSRWCRPAAAVPAAAVAAVAGVAALATIALLVGLEACPAPPPTRIEVQLGAPLGNRQLLDGGVFPPRGVESPTCCG